MSNVIKEGETERIKKMQKTKIFLLFHLVLAKGKKFFLLLHHYTTGLYMTIMSIGITWSGGNQYFFSLVVRTSFNFFFYDDHDDHHKIGIQTSSKIFSITNTLKF